MEKHNETRINQKNKDENWVDDLLQRQEHDLEEEEEILSSIPKRIKHKYLETEE